MSHAETDRLIAALDGDPPEIARALSQAMLLHHIGRLSEAVSLYRGVLTLQPDHGEALRLLQAALGQLQATEPGTA